MAGITIRGLSKSFGARDASFAAVADLDLDIADNSFVTLLGPSGCGKTTTLRLIAGYIVPDKGTIEIDGRLLSSPERWSRPRRAAWAWCSRTMRCGRTRPCSRTSCSASSCARIPAAAAKKQVEETLALVNLTGLEARYPNELSGGQQQRVALARSLVVEPSILLLDEPLSNLDAKLRERMRTELKELQRRTGITFVYVTHDQAEALALSDHVAVMSGGRLQQYGTPFEVYAHPSNRMVADFMGLVNLVPGKVREVGNGGGKVELAADLALDFAQHSTGSQPGDSVDVAIRPENIRLLRRPAPPAGSWRKSPTTSSSAISASIMRRCLRPGAARADPSAAAFQGRGRGCGRDRCDAM